MFDVFIFDVGCGNMALVRCPDGQVVLIDCNLTDNNQRRVLRYLKNLMGNRRQIDFFINTHRDADHMRGLELIDELYPIKSVIDSGVPGTTTSSPEYEIYMRIRRNRQQVYLRPFFTYPLGGVSIVQLNPQVHATVDANLQSLVVRLSFKGSSIIFMGDTGCETWETGIIPVCNGNPECYNYLRSNLMVAPHHGSLSFFGDRTTGTLFEDHLSCIRPDATIVSVGPNPHGLPDGRALTKYRKLGTGIAKRILRTDRDRNIWASLRGNGDWDLKLNHTARPPTPLPAEMPKQLITLSSRPERQRPKPALDVTEMPSTPSDISGLTEIPSLSTRRGNSILGRDPFSPSTLDIASVLGGIPPPPSNLPADLLRAMQDQLSKRD